jgi:acetyl-CoA synthetase
MAEEKKTVAPIPQLGSYIHSMEQYKKMHHDSLYNREQFWGQAGHEFVDWIKPFTHATQGCLENGDGAWYVNGKLNACYNCVDRHVPLHGGDVAILWEGDEPGDNKRITYKELLDEVCRLANLLKRLGIRKGDAVAIYMPMIPEVTVAMLACARIGAVHSVVFAGFSSEALRDRCLDCGAKVVLTANEGLRGRKRIALKGLCDKAVIECPKVTNVIVYKRTDGEVPMVAGRDLVYQDEVANERPYCPCEVMDSEDPLFFLYTSGSTGKPKGIMHTHGGYLVYAAMTHKYVFDYRPGEVYACVADVGWITGHTYIVYGPLLNGAITTMFESIPTFPDAGRYWDMVQRLKINIFYTSPTAIRALMRFGDTFVKKYDRSSLRILGSVGEPINPEAWNWYFNVVGDSRCPICDTYWQTESGGHMITCLPGAFAMKPGSASLPFFGIETVLYDANGVELVGAGSGQLCIKQTWPGLARTIFGDHARYMDTYMKAFRGTYFTGDGANRDDDGFIWITGRSDDVVKVSGHRFGTAEVEAVLATVPSVVESAVVGIEHDIKGQAMFAYVILKDGYTASPELVKELVTKVRSYIGAFAAPDHVLITAALPKTRSGKIMRRILRKIADKKASELGDISTLDAPEVVRRIVDEVAAYYAKK